MLKYINAHKHNRSFSQAIIIMYSHIIFPIITTLYNTTLTNFLILYVSYQLSNLIKSSGFLLLASAFNLNTCGYSLKTYSNCLEFPFVKK